MRRSIVFLTALLLLGAPPANAADDLPLIDAVKAVDVEAVRALLDQRADVHAAAVDGTTALHWAAYRNATAIAELLIDAGASVTAENRYHVQPLSLACVNGNAAMVTRLLDAGADPNTMMPEGETALMTAARTGDLEVVEALLDAGADVSAHETWRGQTALMWAAAEGHSNVIPTLLSHGAEVDARSTKGYTPLLFAAREGRIGSVQTLLEAGADPHVFLPVERRRDAGGTSAEAPPTGLNVFLMAAANAHYELAAMLLDRGAEPDTAPRGWTALHQLTWVRKAGIAGSNNPAPKGSGDMDSLTFARKLVTEGADLNARVTQRPPAGITRMNMIGATPFLLAARTADVEYMTLLLELGADPHLTNEERSTALMIAAGLGTSSPGEDPGTEPEVLEAVKLVLELGADINAVDSQGETAMHGAAYKHVPTVVRFLADTGADVNVWNQRNADGWTPLNITEGIHVGMNILSSPPTAEVIREVMEAAGVAPVFSR